MRLLLPYLGVALVLLPRAASSDVFLLHNCDSDKGTTLTWGADVDAKSVAVATDKQFVSEGTGSLHLSGTATGKSERAYLGVKIPVAKADLRERTLLVDVWTSTPAATNALYVRLYDGAGQKVGSWVNWGDPFSGAARQTLKLHRLVSAGGFAFEAQEVEDRQPSEVTAVELVVGTRVKEGRFDLYVDNVRYGTQPLQSVQSLTTPKGRYPDTVLSADGLPKAVIVHPDDAVHQALAKTLAEVIRVAGGANLPTATQAPNESTNLILLGNLSNNPAVVPLYGQHYCATDDLYPGKGGYVLRTIHDPWGTGKNAILLGGSDAAGVRRAVEEFAKLLKPGKQLVVPPTFKRVPGEELQRKLPWLTTPPGKDYVAKQIEAATDALAAGAHTGLFGMIAGQGERYLWTGFDEYAQAFVQLVLKANEHYLTKPSTYGGPWGMDSDFTAYRVFPGWDAVEESPNVTDAQRLQVTKVLGQWIAEAVAPKTPGLGRAERVRHNHQTFPSLGCYFAGAYFEKYYGGGPQGRVVEGPQWSALGRTCFEIQSKAFKSMEDCNGYQWLTLGHTIDYATSSGDYTYFENGNARREADFCLLCMDNLGYQVPYGDTGSFKCWFSELPLLRRAAWYYASHGNEEAHKWAATYQWALAKKAAVTDTQSLNQHAREQPAEPPKQLLGVHAWPVDPIYYNTMTADPRPPVEKCVDKVVMRASFDADKQYLLLDGLSNGGHKHYDGNTISRITDRERIWLADNDYYKAQPKFHNGVLIFKDGQSQKIPDYCELEGVGDLPSVGFSRTVVRDYAGVDWHRSILWEKERYFVVVDEVVAKEPSDFSFRAKWHLIGEPTVRDDGVEVEQEGKRFFAKHGSDVRLKVEDDTDLGTNWAGYKYAKPIVRGVTQITDAKLAVAQSAVLPTVLYGSDDDRPLDLAVSSLPNQTLSLSDGKQTTLVDARISHQGDRDDALAIEAQASMVSADRLVAFGARAIAVARQPVVTASAPVDIQFSLADLTGTIKAAADCQVLVKLGTGTTVTLDGKPVTNPEQFTVPAGMHQLAVTNATAALLRDAVKSGLAGGKQPQSLPTPPLEVSNKQPLKQLWSFREKFSEYLLTDNQGYFEAVDVGAKVTLSPAPRTENWFGGDSNEASNLTDGIFLQTDGSVQWDDDQPVTVTVALAGPYDLTRVRLKEWWANASSKGKTFQLDRALLEVSNDGFRQDVRKAGEIVDREARGNWGAPGYGPIPYDFKELGQRAQFLRLTLTPKKGAAIYLSEVEVWGRGEKLEVSADEARKRGMPVHTYPTLFTADVDGDGRDEVVAGSTSGSVYLIDDDGEKLWEFVTEQPIYAGTAADLDGDGKVEIIAGGADQTVHCLDSNGKERWQQKLPRYKDAAEIHVLFTAKLSAGKERAVIAGADSWRYYAFDHTGKELWLCESVHRSTAGTAADIDGDGVDEIFCGTEYYWWPCVRADGQQAWSYSTATGPKANAAAAGDLDGDGKDEVVVGGADSNVHALDDNGKLLWQYNTGDEVTSVQCVDLDGDGTKEILVGSMSFNGYALKGDGTRLWRRSMGEAVSALCLTGAPTHPIALGTAAGQVALVGPDGALLRAAEVGAPILGMAAGRAGQANATHLAVSAADGTIRALALSED
ncbi:MAG: hypothetical protein COY42_13195 [Armatimonadetes bacterium CG_4_10_14_0_8_um_filter_66_14]|nr:MAG: hypothetical protein COY42_13195 [Armatimonadetes bacterium CG_4_10_14_0_8_um_filter_66_14]